MVVLSDILDITAIIKCFYYQVLEKKKEEPKKELLVTQQRSSVKELASKLKDVHVGAAPQKKKGTHFWCPLIPKYRVRCEFNTC
jgi:hypothetical protein